MNKLLNMLKKIQETVKFLQNKISLKPEIGIILGTGLHNFAREINITDTIPYKDIPNFPVSTVKGHHGRLIFGTIRKKPVVAMQGRFHFYEGYTMQEVTFPIRVMKHLGIRHLFLSNASGGTNPSFKVGDIMIVKDHINLTNSNPLTGKNHNDLGPRFPDMSRVYNQTLIDRAVEIAKKHNINYQLGVYAAVSGPNYETPAEYKYIMKIGADAVGMSTAPEAIVAQHMGLSCFAVSVISDLGVEGKIEIITHEGVIDAASLAEPQMTKMIKELIETL